jgi:HEAT repeat protein
MRVVEPAAEPRSGALVERPVGTLEPGTGAAPPQGPLPGRAGTWEERLEGLGALKDGDYGAGREFARSLATFLGDPGGKGSVDKALEELLRLAREGAAFQASVLATALGLVPDPDVASRLASLLPSIEHPVVRTAVVWSLAQNRYGDTVPPGSWTAHQALADANTPIHEQPVRAALLEFSRQHAEDGHPLSRKVSHDIVEVLGFSADQPDVEEYLLGILQGRESPGKSGGLRSSAAHSLGMRRSPRGVQALAERLKEDGLPGEEYRSVATACMMHGDPDAVRWALARIERTDGASGSRPILLSSFGALRSTDPALLEEVARVLATWMLREDRTGDQMAAIIGSGPLSGRRECAPILLPAFAQVIRSPKSSLANRTVAVRMIWPRPESFGSYREALLGALAGGPLDPGLRKAILDAIVERTPAPMREDTRRALEDLASSAVEDPGLLEGLRQAVAALERGR